MKQSNDDSGAAWRDALTASSLGWELALPIFGGVLLGHLMDRRLGTGYVFTLGLLVLGVGTGFYNLVRSIQRLEARERKRAVQKDEQVSLHSQPQSRRRRPGDGAQSGHAFLHHEQDEIV